MSCEKQNHEDNLVVEKLKLENNFLKQKNDSLNTEIKKAKLIAVINKVRKIGLSCSEIKK